MYKNLYKHTTNILYIPYTTKYVITILIYVITILINKYNNII